MAVKSINSCSLLRCNYWSQLQFWTETSIVIMHTCMSSCYLLMKSALFFRLHAEKQDLCFCRCGFTNHDVWENVKFRSMLIPVYLEWKTNKILVFCLNSQWREWMISKCRGVVSKIYDPLYKAKQQCTKCKFVHCNTECVLFVFVCTWLGVKLSCLCCSTFYCSSIAKLKHKVSSCNFSQVSKIYFTIMWTNLYTNEKL